MGIWRALSSEMLKIRHSLSLRLACIAPLLVAAIHFASFFDRDPASWARVQDPWQSYTLNLVIIWCLLMQPLFVTLQTALLGGLEHSTAGWKHLFALPIGRGAVYAAKQIVAVGVTSQSSLLLSVLAVPSGLLMGALRPESRLTMGTVPWVLIARLTIYPLLASWAIVAFHSWLGMRSPSFVLACSVGIGATVASILISNSDYGPYCPWSIAGVVGEAVVTGDLAVFTRSLLLGVGGGALATILGGWEFCRHEVA
jgi:hypothetical protein